MSTERSERSQLVLDELLAEAVGIARQEGGNATSIPYLTVFRRSHQNPLSCSILNPSICLVVRGEKRFQLGAKVVDYGPGDFLISMIDVPVSGQVIHASEASPYIGMKIDFSLEEIVTVAIEARIDVDEEAQIAEAAAFIGSSDTSMLEVFQKILRLHAQEGPTHYLAALYKKELLFRLICGAYGPHLLRYVQLGQQNQGVGQVIAWIKDNYQHPMDVKQLARMNNMSVSALQHRFKAITALGPLQYQKQMRLQTARRLMLGDGLDATSAAFAVGYSSSSQFSREYKRLFGLPPQQDIKILRDAIAPYGI